MPTAPPKNDAGAKGKGPAGKLDLGKKVGPLPVWGWIAVAVVGVLIYRHLTANSSSTSSTGSTASGSTTEPTETLTTSGGTYTGPAGDAPSSVANPGGSSVGSTPGSTGASTPGSGGNSSPALAAGAGFGQTTIGGTLYDILGIESGNGPQAYAGYNVSGGAPVYYEAPGSKAPSQGAGQAVQGAQVLTPAVYGSDISKTQTHARQ